MAGPVTYTDKGAGLALRDSIVAQGFRIWIENGQAFADDPVAVQAIINAFDPLPTLKAAKLATLKAAVSARADMFGLMDSGSSTTVSATQFGTFWAAAINNYRVLKAQIAAAPDAATLAAINLGTGWPANP